MRRSRRRFEMIPGPSRHKFEIRDLNDYNENTVIVPLSLPKLPTERREIVTNGLIRSTNSYTTDNETDMSISEGKSSRPTSFISTASEADSFEEEKLKIDTSCSEKSSKVCLPSVLTIYSNIFCKTTQIFKHFRSIKKFSISKFFLPQNVIHQN